MSASESRKRLLLIVTGLLFLFAPLLILAATLEVLILFGDIELSDLSLLELLELYVLDAILLSLFAFGVYRMTLYMLGRKSRTVAESSGEPPDDNDDPE